MKQRSLLLFENSIRSQETLEIYRWYLKKFKEFFKLRDYDSMAHMEQKQIQILVEDYVMDLKKRANPNSVPCYVYPIKSFFEANDIDLRWKKIVKLFPSKIKKTGRESWNTEHIQKMLNVTSSIKNQALIHFLSSTACRIGALPDLKIKHVYSMEDCKCITIYEDDPEEYFVFLTPEASAILDQYLEQRRQDGEYVSAESPLFRAKYTLGIEKARPLSKKALVNIMSRIAKNAGLRDPSTKKTGRFPQQIDHGFRKRFTTILKLNEKMPVAITERLLGHKMYNDGMGNKILLDDSYLTATREQLFEKFKITIPDLTISDKQRDALKIQGLENKDDKIAKLEANMAKYKELWDENTKLSTDKEYRNKELEPLVRNIKEAVKRELRAELLKEIRIEEKK